MLASVEASTCIHTCRVGRRRAYVYSSALGCIDGFKISSWLLPMIFSWIVEVGPGVLCAYKLGTWALVIVFLCFFFVLESYHKESFGCMFFDCCWYFLSSGSFYSNQGAFLFTLQKHVFKSQGTCFIPLCSSLFFFLPVFQKVADSGNSYFDISVVNLSSNIEVSDVDSWIEVGVINFVDKTPPLIWIEMRQVGVGFSLGEISMINLILVRSLMEECEGQSVARILGHMFKREITEDEVRWGGGWRNDQDVIFTVSIFYLWTVKKTWEGRRHKHLIYLRMPLNTLGWKTPLYESFSGTPMTLEWSMLPRMRALP